MVEGSSSIRNPVCLAGEGVEDARGRRRESECVMADASRLFPSATCGFRVQAESVPWKAPDVSERCETQSPFSSEEVQGALSNEKHDNT